MALDTVIYPQDPMSIWGYDYLLQEDKSFCGFLESNNLYQYHEQAISVHANNWDYCSSSSVMHNNNSSYDMKDNWGTNSSPDDCTGSGTGGELGSPNCNMMTESHLAAVATSTVAAAGRRKRRRTKSGKNKEELENQRMTHITVERNRRKQMNEYLAVIRSLMPSSYVQRGDQASIIGGAINFVKELEQQLQTLEVQKRAMDQEKNNNNNNNNGYSPPPLPFREFFTFPQYSNRSPSESDGPSVTAAENRPQAMAEIEVTMVESHANLKILSKKRHRQLLKMVAGLQCLWLTILHLNVTTVDQMVLYSVSVKLEDGCQLSTVDEIADAVNCLLGRIEEEAL